MLLARAVYARTFASRLRGLRNQDAAQGILMRFGKESRLLSAVHTLGMRQPIGVIWLDKSLQVVDARLAQPWRPAHISRAPALYCLEATPDILQHARIGDQLAPDEIEP